jgi:hypothetical protein
VPSLPLQRTCILSSIHHPCPFVASTTLPSTTDKSMVKSTMLAQCARLLKLKVISIFARLRPNAFQALVSKRPQSAQLRSINVDAGYMLSSRSTTGASSGSCSLPPRDHKPLRILTDAVFLNGLFLQPAVARTHQAPRKCRWRGPCCHSSLTSSSKCVSCLGALTMLCASLSYRFTYRDGRKGPPVGNKARCNRTNTPHSKALSCILSFGRGGLRLPLVACWTVAWADLCGRVSCGLHLFLFRLASCVFCPRFGLGFFAFRRQCCCAFSRPSL